MPRTLVRLPALFTRSELPAPSTPPTDRHARRFVALVGVAAFALVLVFVVRTTTRIPYLDEYYNVHLVADPLGVPLAFYWSQHNEHRIPLPRVLYVAAVKLAGNSFRGPPVMNVLLLAAAAALLTRAVAKVRGRYAYSDAFLPLIVLNIGQWENLFWGFQVQFFSSSVLALLVLAVVIHPRFAESVWRVAAAGLITVLVPLCGANGLALTPAFACLLLYVAMRNFWSGERTRRAPGVVAFVGGLAGLAMVPLYLHDLHPVGHHTSAKSLQTVAVNAVNFLGIGFGSVAFTAHGPQPTGVALYGWGMLGLLLATAGLLIAHARTAERMTTAIGIACVIGAVLSLGLALAYGRGEMGGLLGCNRYSTLAMPLVAAVYVAWAVLPSRFGRLVPAALLVVAVGGVWSNATQAFAVGKFWHERQARTEAEIRAGVPLTFVIDRHHHPIERDHMQRTFQSLRDQQIEPFRDLVPDPAMDETPVPVRVVASEGMEVSGGVYRVTGNTGGVVFELPRHQHVFGFKVVYEATCPRGTPLLSLVSWGPGGTVPPRPGYGIIENLYETPAGPMTVHVFADRDTDRFRVDLVTPGATVRVHALSVLTRRE